MKKKKLVPWPLLVLFDIAAIGACLCIYALFHHVIGFSAMTVAATSKLPSITPSPAAVVETTAPVVIEETPAVSADESEAPETVPEVTPEPTPEPTPSPEPIDYGQFGEKFADKFTTDGEIINEENLYVSENVRVELIEDRAYNTNIRILDIYVKNITNFRTGFASGEDVFDGKRNDVMSIAQQFNAVAATNGDFCGFSQYGEYCVLRNGLLFKSNPTRGCCVLFYDGTMKTYWQKWNLLGPGFNIDELIEQGAWQIWCFGPSLLDEEGHANSLYDTNVYNPRTVIGYYEPGHYVLITFDGRRSDSTGVNFDQAGAYCESLGLKVAFNLDGGGSMAMTFGDRVVTYGNVNEGLRPVTDIIYVVDGNVSITGEAEE